VDDLAYRNAMRKRDDLAAEINKLQERLGQAREELARVDGWIAVWREFAGVSEQSGTDTAPVDSGDAALVARPKNPTKEEVAEVAREIIRDADQPLMRADLFQRLQARGIVLHGKDPEMVLSTMLWRMRSRIVRLRGGGYWLADVPNSDVGYDPQNRAVIAEAVVHAMEAHPDHEPQDEDE
jgi:hypothetical protein